MIYEDFIKELYQNEDLKYKEFHSRIIKSNNLIGVRTDKLKKIAKKIKDYQYFIKNNKHSIYEETMVHGFMIGNLKENPSIELLKFIKYIDNWAICDLTVSNLKWFKKNKKEGLITIDKLIKNDDRWSKRVGYTLLLNYYIEEDYLNLIFNYAEESNTHEYYVLMAIAWLLSTTFIKYPQETKDYLNRSKMDKFTYNKTLQKIIESRRTNEETKKELRCLKRI
ncbi:MAG: DNA alkylation repair protein [Bacilli bacterium]